MKKLHTYLVLALVLLIMPLKVSAFTANDAKNSPMMQPGVWYTGVATSDKEGIFQFQVTQRGYVNVTLKAADNADTNKIGWGWELSVYEKDNVSNYFLNESDIQGKYTTPKLSLKPGTYYAVINTEFLNKDQPFSIKFDQVSSTQWEQEDNGTYQVATPITPNQTIYGMSIPNSDLDWYSFTVPQDGSLTVRINRESWDSNGRWDTYLYKYPDLSTKKLSLWGASEQKTITVTPGTYYIMVNSSWDGYQDTYSLTTSYTPFKTNQSSSSTSTAKPKRASFKVSGKKGKAVISISTKATKYEIQYGKKKSMKNCKKKITASSKVTLKKLSRKKNYYFRVRLINSSGKKGAWSSVKKVKIK